MKKDRLPTALRSLKNRLSFGNIQMIAVPMIILILILSAPLACNSGTKPSAQDQPAAAVTSKINTALDGVTLLDERCSTCHGANRAKQTRKTIDQWDKTVSRMMGKGARLTEVEKAVLMDYLAKNYGQ